MEAWESNHSGKSVKLAIAPYLATAASYDALWVTHLTQTAPMARAPGGAGVPEASCALANAVSTLWRAPEALG